MHYYEIKDHYGNIIKCWTTDIDRVKKHEKKYKDRLNPKSGQWCPDAKRSNKKIPGVKSEKNFNQQEEWLGQDPC